MNPYHPPTAPDSRRTAGKKAKSSDGRPLIGGGAFVAAMTGFIASPFEDLWPFFMIAAFLFLAGCIRAKTTLTRFIGGFAAGFAAFTALISYSDR